MGFPSSTSGKKSTCQCRRQELWVWSLSQEDHLKEGMATYSSILVWRISGTEEPGRLQSLAFQKVRHNCSDLAFTWVLRRLTLFTPNSMVSQMRDFTQSLGSPWMVPSFPRFIPKFPATLAATKVTGGKGAGHNIWKNVVVQGHNIKSIRMKWDQDGRQN